VGFCASLLFMEFGVRSVLYTPLCITTERGLSWPRIDNHWIETIIQLGGFLRAESDLFPYLLLYLNQTTGLGPRDCSFRRLSTDPYNIFVQI
jgi:hypothetical protein